MTRKKKEPPKHSSQTRIAKKETPDQTAMFEPEKQDKTEGKKKRKKKKDRCTEAEKKEQKRLKEKRAERVTGRSGDGWTRDQRIAISEDGWI